MADPWILALVPLDFRGFLFGCFMSWLISKALMNSLSLPEQVEEYLGASCSDGEPSVLLNGNPTPQAYLSPGKMTDFSRLSRFGMTFKPLTDDLGEELLTLYRAGFPVKTYPAQEKAQGLTESDQECGEKWPGSFTKYDPDTLSWKTAQCSLLGGLESFSETWPQWGLMRDGVCWEQRTLEQTIRGTESGSLPETWPTPRVMEVDESYEGYIARMQRSGNPKNMGKTKPNNLTMAVKMFPTPTCHNSKEGAYPAEFTRKTPTLATHAGGKLNPMWVEWLMGWPLAWTDLKPLATGKSHCVRQQLGKS
jgi:hypothetical protein